MNLQIKNVFPLFTSRPPVCYRHSYWWSSTSNNDGLRYWPFILHFFHSSPSGAQNKKLGIAAMQFIFTKQ